MASCKQCGAPLAANTNRCNYCGARNDVDLHAHLPYKTEQSISKRTCPGCRIALTTIRLLDDASLYIERCQHCFGLFFDRGEIEIFLNESVSHTNEINLEHIDNINKDRYRKPGGFQYRKCPQCGILMNRVSFGYRSGVVVDQCSMHGVWLDNGDLKHLQEWKKAGGQLLQHRQSAASKKSNAPTALPGPAKTAPRNSWENFSGELGWETAVAILWLIWKLLLAR